MFNIHYHTVKKNHFLELYVCNVLYPWDNYVCYSVLDRALRALARTITCMYLRESISVLSVYTITTVMQARVRPSGPSECHFCYSAFKRRAGTSYRHACLARIPMVLRVEVSHDCSDIAMTTRKASSYNDSPVPGTFFTSSFKMSLALWFGGKELWSKALQKKFQSNLYCKHYILIIYFYFKFLCEITPGSVVQYNNATFVGPKVIPCDEGLNSENNFKQWNVKRFPCAEKNHVLKMWKPKVPWVHYITHL